MIYTIGLLLIITISIFFLFKYVKKKEASMTITTEQLIEIAKAGFPDRVKQFINFDNCESMRHGNVYRLYDKDCEFVVLFPKEEHLSIILEIGFVQIVVGNKAFNHLAGIRKMQRLGLI